MNGWVSVAKFRTKAFEIEAVQFTEDNFAEVHKFTEGPEGKSQFAGIVLGEGEEVRIADENDEFQAQVYDDIHDTWVNVKYGQWIIKGQKGEFYPCDPEIFDAKYEEINEGVTKRQAHSSSADSILRGAESSNTKSGIITSHNIKPNSEQGRRFQ